eukprot:COSAG06_NODE_8552_length_2131_cov_1.619094_2_plen_50_part_01
MGDVPRCAPPVVQESCVAATDNQLLHHLGAVVSEDDKDTAQPTQDVRQQS